MKTLYATTSRESTRWAEPFETIYQAQRRERGQGSGRGYRPDITPPLRLLIASAVAMGEDRPRGMITWLAEVLSTSRETIYTIGAAWGPKAGAEEPSVEAENDPEERRRQIARAALTLLVPGAMCLRRVQESLASLHGLGRSLGWLSELVDEAGQRAGAVLEGADWSAAGEMIAARDEFFYDGLAWLLTVDAQSHAILSGYVENGVDAEVWGLSLALDQERTGYQVVGLSEDEAGWYEASVGIAQQYLGSPFRLAEQKDVWHLLRRARQAARDAERIALAALKVAEKKASRLRPGFWAIYDFMSDWQQAHEVADRAIWRADQTRIAVDLLTEVLELVDRRTGQVLDRDTAEGYLQMIVQHLRDTGGKPATSLADALDRQAAELLTFHDWLAMDLAGWRKQAQAHFGDVELVDLFERAVARAWQRARAVTNGARRGRPHALRAAAIVAGLCQNDPVAKQLAVELDQLLDGTVRTSSACENVNSILRAYLWGRRAFKSRRTAQNWLNLLMLWYNLHVFQRGKRKGRSPFELAGVVVHSPDSEPTTDWLSALGYGPGLRAGRVRHPQIVDPSRRRPRRAAGRASSAERPLRSVNLDARQTEPCRENEDR